MTREELDREREQSRLRMQARSEDAREAIERCKRRRLEKWKPGPLPIWMPRRRGP